MLKPEVKIFDTGTLLVESLSEHVKDKIHKKTGNFYMALSGGSTPKLWFQHLSGYHLNDVEWGKVQLFWGDERCVPYNDPESNYGVTRKLLLEHVPVPPENIHPVATELNPENAAKDYQEKLIKIFPGNQKVPAFDLIILGMGEDGHTASIFPWEIELWDANSLCVVGHHPDTGQSRVSFSGKLINHAHEIIFLVMGEKKADKVAEIIAGKPEAADYPASLVSPESGQLFWFIDKLAASKL